MILAGTTVLGTASENDGLVLPTRGGWTFYQTDTGEVYRATEDGSAWSAYRNLPDTEYVIFTGSSAVNQIIYPNNVANALRFVDSNDVEFLRYNTVPANRAVLFNYEEQDMDFYIYYDGGIGFFVSGTTGIVEMDGQACVVYGKLGVGNAAPPAWIVDIRDDDPLIVITNTVTPAVDVYSEIRFRVQSGIFAGIRGGIGSGATNEGFLSVHTRSGVAYPERVRIDHAGYVGIGTPTPIRQLHVYATDSANTSVTWTNRYSHYATGTIVAGHGIGVEMTITDTAAIQQIAGRWSVVWTSAGSKNADLIFDLMSGGAAAAERARLTDAGDWKIVRDYYSGGSQGLSTSFTTGDARTATFTGGILTGLV